MADEVVQEEKAKESALLIKRKWRVIERQARSKTTVVTMAAAHGLRSGTMKILRRRT